MSCLSSSTSSCPLQLILNLVAIGLQLGCFAFSATIFRYVTMSAPCSARSRPQSRSAEVSGKLRMLWHEARRLRGLRRFAAAVDRARWARTIRAAGLVDAEYVSAQLGRRVSARGAVRRYVHHGFQTGLRLNPLFVDVTVGDRLPQVNMVPALYAYLVNDPRGVQVSPLWDSAAYLRAHPERADEPGGAVGAAWRRRETESLPFGPDALPAPVDWTLLRTTVLEAAGAARSHTDASAGSHTSAAPVELLVALGSGEVDVDESIAELIETADAMAVAVAVSETQPEVWTQVALLCTCRPGIRALFRPRLSPAAALSELLASSNAETIVLRGPHQSLTAETAAALAAVAAEGVFVAPLWRDADGTIAAAGAARDGRVLAAHPFEDAAALSDDGVVPVPALAGTTFAAPRAMLPARLHDGDTAAWATVARPGTAAQVHTGLSVRSRVPAPPAALPPIAGSADALMMGAGWIHAAHGPAPHWRRPLRTVRLGDGTEVPGLRWALRTPAPAGPEGEWWGDTIFARAMADALRRLGQEVVVDAFPARSRSTAHLDDVTLVLRGMQRTDPPATGTSVLWIISHPDEIGREELDGFDLVFAASEPWARAASARFDRAIGALLQCTDATRFRPSGLDRGDDIIFVGKGRGFYRPSVVEPVRAGVPVKVYGPDWREWIPAHAIAGVGIPNAELPTVYEHAAAVLNDHLPAMQREGFISNRPYDVVAAGGRVISDRVEGIAELFEGAVVTYRDTKELIALLRGDLDALFPDEPELARISAQVRERHSFDARARFLLDAVTNRLP